MYSRRIKTEEARNKRKATFFIILSIVFLFLLATYGLSSFAKFAAFLSELKTTNEAPDITDTTPPPPPIIEALPKATKEPNLEVRGVTEAGATVVLNLNGKDVEFLADKEGKFSYSFTLKKNENSLFLEAQDASGNKSVKTQVYKILYDTAAPELEIIKPADGSEFFGSKQRQIAIVGKTKDALKVQINDRLVVIDSDGTFSFATSLVSGENNFLIKVEDEAGNTTEKSLRVSFTP